jgi:HD-GYP domain-containing protein (c-di-GMP phosphodiesterase class II)
MRVPEVEFLEGKKLYSSAIISTFVKFIKARYNFVNITELLLYAGMEAYQVEDTGHWFTQTQVDRFYECLVRMSGQPNIAREAGRYTSSPDAMGLMARYALGFLGPANVFEMIGEVTKRYSLSAKYESRRVSKTEYELTVTPYEGIHEKEYQCQNRIGYFEAIVRLFNARLPKIDHPECLFHGGKVCRYIVTWHKSSAEVWKRIRNVFVPVALVGLSCAALAGQVPYFPFLAGGAGLLALGFTFLAEYFEKLELRSAINNLRTTTEQLIDNVSLNYNHALMINEIGRIIGKYIQIETLLPQVIEILKKRLDYDRGLILLVNADKTRLEYRTGFGYSPDTVEELARESFHLDRPESRGVFVLCYREQKPFLINDVEEIKNDLSERSRRFLRKIGSKSFLCCPILHENECLGVLAVDNVQSKRPLLESDLNLLMGIAPEIGISIHNALLIDEREQQFQSVIRTLAASIDARDTMTSGHSQRVTDFAVQICREMNLTAEFTEVIRVASQLHDYGKIAIKDSILKKEGALTDEERREIETHAAKSEEILSQIKFFGAFQQVPFIAGSHHERLDGGGYPRGLLGDEIPFGARIIAVADFFEAITAKRHYRDPMSFQQAVELLKKESGPHLEPVIVQAFLKILGVQEKS